MNIGDLIKEYKERELLSPTPKQYLLAGMFFWRETDNRIITREDGKKICHVLGNNIEIEEFRLLKIDETQTETQEALGLVLTAEEKIVDLTDSTKSSQINLFKLARICLEKYRSADTIIELSEMLARVGNYPESHILLFNNKEKYPLPDNNNYYFALAKSYRRIGYSNKAKEQYEEISSQEQCDAQIRTECQVEIALIDSEDVEKDISDVIKTLDRIAKEAPEPQKFRCYYYLGLLQKRRLRRRRSSGYSEIEPIVCSTFLRALEWKRDDTTKLDEGKVYRAFAKSFVGVYKKVLSILSNPETILPPDIQSSIQEKIIQPYIYVSGIKLPEIPQTSINEAKSIDTKILIENIIEDSFKKAIEKLQDYPMILEVIFQEKAVYDELVYNYKYFLTGDTYNLRNLLFNSMSDNRMTTIDNIVHDNKNQRIDFLSERHRQNNPDIANHSPILYILQHWNSFTPIIPSNSSSKGGGYYIDTGREGIVFDPGFDFIKNYMGTTSASDTSNSRLQFSDIDMLFITHAHNDHTADIESLLTLLHEYNEQIKGDEYSSELSCTVYSLELAHAEKLSVEEYKNVIKERWEQKSNKRRKYLDIYLSMSTFKKYATIFDLHKNNDYQIHLIDSETGYIKIKDSSSCGIIPIRAEHDDMMSDRDSLGFIFYTDDCFLVYTGDTGFTKNLKEKTYKLFRTTETRNEDCPCDFQELARNRTCILLAHIGGFKEYEKSGYLRIPPYDSYYKNHLGRLGLIDLIYTLEPDLSLVSEFGEEFQAPPKKHNKQETPKEKSNRLQKSPRIQLCNILQSQMRKVYRTTILPADIGLHVRIGKEPVVEYANEGFTRRWVIPAKNNVLAELREDDDGYLGLK